MALTVTTFGVDYLQMNATAGVATKVTGPKGARAVRLEGDGVATYWNPEGTDGGAMGDNKNTIASGAHEWVPLHSQTNGATPAIYLGSDTINGNIRVLFSRVAP